jgi:hypothetical protein
VRPAQVLCRAESVQFVEGAQWDERHAGTNAPGTDTTLGVIDITGGRDAGSPQTIAMVRAAARPERTLMAVAATRRCAPSRGRHSLSIQCVP